MPDRMCSAPAYMPNDLPFLVRCEINAPHVIFSPTQSRDALVTGFFTISAYSASGMFGVESRLVHPAYPTRWGARCEIRQSRVGSDTTCHGAITLFPKNMPDRICSAPAYMSNDLPFLVRYGINAPHMTQAGGQGMLGINIGYGPMAVGPRWLAYASNNPLQSNTGHLSPQNLSPSPGVSPSTSPSRGCLVAR